MEVVLGDGLVIPGVIDKDDLKKKCRTYFEENPATAAQGNFKYKNYKVFYTKAGNKVTLTKIEG